MSGVSANRILSTATVASDIIYHIIYWSFNFKLWSNLWNTICFQASIYFWNCLRKLFICIKSQCYCQQDTQAWSHNIEERMTRYLIFCSHVSRTLVSHIKVHPMLSNNSKSFLIAVILHLIQNLINSLHIFIFGQDS